MYYIVILLCTCLLGTSLAIDGPWYCWAKYPPSYIQKGHPTKLQWQGGDGSPITIVLGQGFELFHVVSTIASNVTDENFDWTPSASLSAGPGYFLRLTQGVDNCESDHFTITGDSSAATLNKPSHTTTTLDTSSSTGSGITS